jgi:hypothetical protein
LTASALPPLRLRILASWNTVAVRLPLDMKNGKMQEMKAARHTIKDFVAPLEGLVKLTVWAQHPRVVLNNLSDAHTSKELKPFS